MSQPIYSAADLRDILLRHAANHRNHVIGTAIGFAFGGFLAGWVASAISRMMGVGI